MKLNELLQGSKIELPESVGQIEIEHLCFDSRLVQKNDIFFCMDGMVCDGHDFVDKAIAQGAICIIHRKPLENMQKNIVYLQVDDVNRYLNLMAKNYYQKAVDDLYVFGVTGTNGKSTIANIIYQVFSMYQPCGYIGTIGVKYGEVNELPTLTTPDPLTLHQTFKDMHDHGMVAVALEASSQGLAMGRVDSVSFNQAIFTNLTYDHMDYHITFENYFNAKKRLFDMLDEDGVAITNVDDERGMDIVEGCKGRVVTYGINNEATYRAKNVIIGKDESTFTLIYNGQEYAIKTNLIAHYNIYNLLASIASMHQAGMPLEQIILAITCISQIEGRMELIDEGQQFRVYVDFAHTPDGLEKVFQFAKDITNENGKIIAVFGSAGKRDVNKRKVFGELADKYCDRIILTEDDPRDENPKDIAMQIQEGILDTQCIYIEDRYDAIRCAIEGANDDDCILLLGKGDEGYIYREFGREDWLGDDKAARHIIKKYVLENGAD